MDLLQKIDDYILGYMDRHSFFQVYSFSNENIRAYTKFFDLKKGSLCTVGSSGDQAINAKVAGCRDIVIYDICPLTESYTYLKLAAQQTLGRKELFMFLNGRDYSYGAYRSPSFLNPITFKTVEEKLKRINYDAFQIWQTIAYKYPQEDIEKLFRKDDKSFPEIVRCNNYMRNDHEYNKARKALEEINIKFVTDDIKGLKAEKEFKTIWLSNVAHHLEPEDITQMAKNCSAHLAPGGKMLVCYFWQSGRNIRGKSIEQLSELKVEEKTIRGAEGIFTKDSIYVYTRKARSI